MNTIPDRLPSRPLRSWFLEWHIHAGDSPEMIAKGFEPPQLVIEMLSCRPPLLIETSVALEICARLRADPLEVWAVASLQAVRPAYGVEPLWAGVSLRSLCELNDRTLVFSEMPAERLSKRAAFGPSRQRRRARKSGPS